MASLSVCSDLEATWSKKVQLSSVNDSPSCGRWPCLSWSPCCFEEGIIDTIRTIKMRAKWEEGELRNRRIFLKSPVRMINIRVLEKFWHWRANKLNYTGLIPSSIRHDQSKIWKWMKWKTWISWMTMSFRVISNIFYDFPRVWRTGGQTGQRTGPLIELLWRNWCT